MRSVITLFAGAAMALPALAGAQRTACRVNTTDPWVKRQAGWLDDSKHSWTDDTLRTDLLAAAGLSAPLKAPAQTGVRVEGKEQPLGPTAAAVTERLMKLASTRGS